MPSLVAPPAAIAHPGPEWYLSPIAVAQGDEGRLVERMIDEHHAWIGRLRREFVRSQHEGYSSPGGSPPGFTPRATFPIQMKIISERRLSLTPPSLDD